MASYEKGKYSYSYNGKENTIYYNQAEKEHEVKLLKQKLEYKHLLFMCFSLFLFVVIVLCVIFFYLYRKCFIHYLSRLYRVIVNSIRRNNTLNIFY